MRQTDTGRGDVCPQLIALVCVARGEPALTTREVAEVVDMPEDCVRRELEELREQGRVACTIAGWGEIAWWSRT